ncbi:sulfatase-like hydrolase/transferase [Xanthobacter pseudotagetidis]|uniref:sulfatase-like hydrolase/transferase n=1 Tax=Xanthobacter pseudotagetidis TaxID=3119911 RepID=UPI00372B069E
MRGITRESVLFITLDSCRYDTFLASRTPAIDRVSAVFRAQAPSHFTYASHAAMFVGFTPGVAQIPAPLLNPKFARLFRLGRAGHAGHAKPGFTVDGQDIIAGFRAAGYHTVGTGAAGWFDSSSPVSQRLIGNFEQFRFTGEAGVRHQLAFVEQALARRRRDDAFVFINVGETHVPYHFEGAPWPAADNPCRPFQQEDRADTCRSRQRLCLEYVDAVLAPLIDAFAHATIIVCADHGDCWGEDGLWEHGISHPMTLTVPLLIRYRGQPVEEAVELPEAIRAGLDRKVSAALPV